MQRREILVNGGLGLLAGGAIILAGAVRDPQRAALAAVLVFVACVLGAAKWRGVVLARAALAAVGLALVSSHGQLGAIFAGAVVVLTLVAPRLHRDGAAVAGVALAFMTGVAALVAAAALAALVADASTAAWALPPAGAAVAVAYLVAAARSRRAPEWTD